MNKNFKITIFVFLVFLLLFLSLRYTGKVTEDFSEKFICNESDKEKDYFVKGIVEGNYLNDSKNLYIMSDYCEDENILVEYYCEKNFGDSYIDFVKYECENYCLNGACVQENKFLKNDSMISLFFERLRGLF